MQVIINEGGLTCSTLNPLGDKPELKNYRSDERFTFRDEGRKYIRDLKKWQKAQDERQTFEIEHECEEGVCSVEIPLSLKTRCGLIPGTTHEAEIVNGKAVIK